MNHRDVQRMNDYLTLAGSVLSVLLIIRIMRPDVYTTLRMRAYRTVSRNAKQGADTLTSIAARADTAYHRLTNVTA